MRILNDDNDEMMPNARARARTFTRSFHMKMG